MTLNASIVKDMKNAGKKIGMDNTQTQIKHPKNIKLLLVRGAGTPKT